MAQQSGLTDQQEQYLAWLLDPAKQGSKTAIAELIGVSTRSLRNWEQARDFRDELDRRCDALNLSRDRLQEVVNAMQRKAADGDTQAAKVYLAYVQELGAIRKPPAESRSVEEASDEELERAWRGER